MRAPRRAAPLALLAAAFLAGAAAAAPQARGKVVQVSGGVDLYMHAFHKWKRGVQSGQDLYVGDRLQTNSGASAKVTLYSKSGQDTIDVSADTLLEIPDVYENKEETTWVGMFSSALGQIKCLISRRPPAEGAPNSFNVRTPTAVAGVRGTEFNVTYQRKADTTIFGLKEGVVNAVMASGALVGLLSTDEDVAITGLQVFRVASHLKNIHDIFLKGHEERVNNRYNLLFNVAEVSVGNGTLVNGEPVLTEHEDDWAKRELPFEAPEASWDKPMVVKVTQGHCILHLRHTGWFKLEAGTEVSAYRLGNAILMRLRHGEMHFHRSDPRFGFLERGPAMDVEVFMRKDDDTDLRVIDFSPKGALTRATLELRKPGSPRVYVREGQMKVQEVR